MSTHDDLHCQFSCDSCQAAVSLLACTCLSGGAGSDLAFCGMFDADNHRKYHHEYKHIKGA
eukprot:531579-Amphidinium_carterae.1